MTRTQATSRAPFFGLYGEALTQTEPGFVHVESIAERSSENGWRIKPHRHHRMVQVLLVEQGAADVSLDSVRYHVCGGSVIFIPAETVHGFAFEPGTNGTVLSIASPLLEESMAAIRPDVEVSNLLRPGVLELPENSTLLRSFLQLDGLLCREITQQGFHSNPLIKCLVAALLVLYSRVLEQNQVIRRSPPATSCFHDFVRLTEQNFRRHLGVDWYAEQLNTSTSTLNRNCKGAIGKTAKALLDDRLLLEAKRKLMYTQDSVANIASTLGYEDPAYFCRFFSNREGMPPGRYRKIHSQTTHV
jgi:AraC family transcriptional activator of pobA